MSKSRSLLAGLFFTLAIGAWAPTPVVEVQSNKMVGARIKGLIPEAASSPNKEWKRIGEGSATTIDAFESQSLSLVLMFLAPPEGKKDPRRQDFQFLSQQPVKIAKAISRSMSKGYGSVIQAEDIVEISCAVKGKRATGVVTFRSPGICEGRVEYTARLGDRGWLVNEFRLPNYKVRVTRGADGRWKRGEMGGKK